MSFFEELDGVLKIREEQAKRAIANLRNMDQFRFVYTILSFFDLADVESMLKFHEESETPDRVNFKTAAAMLVAAGYDIQNRYVPATKGGCIFAKRDGKKWTLDITFDTINFSKVETLILLKIIHNRRTENENFDRN